MKKTTSTGASPTVILRLSLLAAVLLTVLFLPIKGDAQVSLDHSWQPNVNFTPPQTGPYGLLDLDGFGLGSYGYCKWGVLMSENSNPLPYTKLTMNQAEMFFNMGVSVLSPISPSATMYQNDPTNLRFKIPNTTDGSTPPINYSLFRKLHFVSTLKNEITGQVLDGKSTKLIVLIHGWNPTSNDDSYGGEFASLTAQLKITMRYAPDWQLVLYHWEPDADTGPKTVGASTFGPRAAENGHQHGQHLGQLLDEITQHNVQKVQFIAHSAGSWAARAATKYLLQNTGAKIQVTLLDPFIPGSIGANTSLNNTRMSEIYQFPNATADSLYNLENYYARDVLPDFALGTQDTFAWRTGVDIGDQRIDWASTVTGVFYYPEHGSPIQFYSDTVAYPNLSDVTPLQPFNVNYIGWRRSMFYQEPVIAPLPNFTKTYSVGESVPLTASVKIRGNLGVALGGATYQWEKKPFGGGWQSVANGTVAASNTPAYAIPGYTIPVISGMNDTRYRLVVTNTAGTDVSNEIILNVGTSGGAVLAAPSGLTASAVSPNQINLSWDNNAVNATSIIIERKAGTGGTYAAIATTPPVLPPTTRAYFDTGLAQGALYYYRIIAAGSPNNSAPSAAAFATTLPGTSTTRVLTINSSSSVSGARIFVGPNDINGVADGNTTFTRQYANNTNVTLVAPTTWTGLSFLKWQKDGEDAGVNAVTNVLMDTSHTMTAVYAAPAQGGTSYNIAVTAAPSNGGTVTGTGSYASNATVSIQATAAPGYTFMKWTVNASEANGGTTFALQPQVSFQATANLSLVANFTFNIGSYWNVTTSSEPPSGGTASGAGTYVALSNVPLSAQPAAGYVFDYWTENGTIISYIQSYQYPQINKSHNFVAHFHIPAPGSAPDLFPRFLLPQSTVFAGGTASRTVAILNQGTLSSNPFWFDFRISESNTVMPVYGNLDFYAQRNFVGGSIPPGVEAGGSGSFTLPSNLPPGTYYMWMVVDPELASGEPAGNRSNNTTWQPLSVPPSPPASGPDLVPHDFTVTPAAVTVGGAINLNGAIRNSGNAASTACKYYISISTSPSIAPDKNALNTFGNIAALSIYSDAGASSGLTLPGTFTAGNYYLWIMTDPENTDGEPAGNRGNNNIVLPLTVLQPLQTFTVAASASPAAAGSVSGGGTYVRGAVVPLIVTPGVGYPFVNWTEGGVPVSTDPTFTFTATGDRTLVANFLVETRVVTPNTRGNGTISPDTPQSVPNGSGTSFTATPNANYRVNAWSVNGSVEQVGGTTFIMSNITANTAVGVTFKPASLPAPGDLDPTFDTDGKVVTAFGSSDDYGQGVAVQTDGKIVAAGYTKNGSNYDLALARYNVDGTPDTSFNGTGQVTCPTGSTNSFTPGMAIQNDGKILIAGWFTVARYNSDGSLDTAFNSTGKVTTPYFAQSMAVQNDGKIVVAGYFTISGSNDFAVARYNANGTLDTSFNGTGKVTTAVGSGADIGYQVVLQSDGKILVTGYTTLAVATDRAVATVRYNSNGSLDTSFNGTGIVTTDFGTSDDEGKGMAVQSDGKIVVAGFGGSSRHILLVRYNTSGSLDTTFNGTGQLVTSGSISAGGRLVLQGDGKILVAGSSTNFFALVRCNANGSMDTSFNDTGIVTTDIGIGADFGSGIALQGDGKIIVIGQVSNGSNYDFGLVRYLAAAEPDITVEQPLSTNVASGSSKSFGSLDVGTNASLTFTIKNTGGADLTDLTLTKDGTDAAMFTLTGSPVAPVSQNGSTTFTVRFAPTSAGVKTAALHIASNVAAKNPFDIALTGSGNTPSESWRQQYFGTTANGGDAADTFDYDRDGIVNLAEYAFGLNPTLNSAGQLPQGQKTGSNFVLSFTEPVGVTGITYGADWSATMAANDWNAITDTGTPPQHTFSVPISGNQAVFIRLKVTSP